jgi:TraM recognition site of TraD and TraG
MFQNILRTRAFVAFALAAASGLVLFLKFPFPDGNSTLALIELRSPAVSSGLLYSYILFLYTTPLILYSGVLSGLYIFAGKIRGHVRPSELPPYPEPGIRDRLYLVVGEVHHPRKPIPAQAPQWLVLPERGLFTGVMILGAIGSGKTSCCMHPFAEQLFAYRASERDCRVGGLVLEVKGDFCAKVKDILVRHGRANDYVEIALDSDYRYNPLHNDLDAYASAYNIASLLNNLFGRGKEPFWQQAYTNLVKFVILLHKLAYDYVTLFDVYECVINPELLEKRLKDAEQRYPTREYVNVTFDTLMRFRKALDPFHFTFDPESNLYRGAKTKMLLETLATQAIPWNETDPAEAPPGHSEKIQQVQAVRRWFDHDWKRIEPKLRTSIVEGISVFLSLFDDNPAVKRTFCPPAECYDPEKNRDHRYGKPLPSFAWLIENGAVCALNFPISMNPGLARAIGVMMKLDFERAVLDRVPRMEAHKDHHFRQVAFICDEYQHFATAGESEPTGDEKFFNLSRQAKCIPIVATQSISSLKSSLPGDTWRTLLQTFRTKIILALSDDFSAKIASELCGREDQLKANYNISESGHNASVSLLTGKPISNRANITTSKSYNTQNDFRFDTKTFTELRNAQAVVIAYDGLNPLPPTFCFLKPYYNDVNKSYFVQLANGEL